jgi:hypothetical protein
MKEKDPIIALIRQLAEMVSIIEEKRGGPDKPLPEGVEESLAELEAQIALFRQVTEETLDEMGIDRVELMRRIKNPPDTMEPERKKAVLQLTHLKKNMNEIQQEMGRQAIIDQAAANQEKTPSRKASHRKRFKRLGGDDTWKPV